jgi:hypothetical protein
MNDARELLRPGKNRDGYFTSEDVLAQATRAMDVLSHPDYQHEDHVFLYDNARTHLARAPDALSAGNMTLNPSSKFSCEKKDADGKKTLVRMRDARFADGTPQALYFPHGHPLAGQFKGMKNLINERRARGAALRDPSEMKAQCKNFKCPPGHTDCCCRRVLFTQPDFASQPSHLEEHCAARGFRVIFLPKFHCELNFIEQVWGYAKRLYREYPASSDETDLENNTLEALDSVPIDCMRRYGLIHSQIYMYSRQVRFSTRSHRFMDAYRKGLDGRQAAWAAKKYRGHRVVPPTILAEFTLAHTL